MYHEWVHIQSAHKCIWMSSYDLYTLWLTTDEFVTRTHCGFVTCVFVTCIHYFMNEFIWLVYIVAHDRWVRDSYTLWLCDMCVRDLYTLLHEWVHMTCIHCGSRQMSSWLVYIVALWHVCSWLVYITSWMSSYDLYTLWLTTDEFVTRIHCGFVTCVFVTCIHYFMNEFIWLVSWICSYTAHWAVIERVHMTCLMNMLMWYVS